MLLLLLISTPLIAAVGTFVVRRNRLWIETIAAIAAPVELAAALLAAADVYYEGRCEFGSFLSLDALGGIVALAVVIVGAGAAYYSIGYLRDEMRKRIIGFQHIKRYFCLFHLFLMAMFWAILTINPIIMWIAIEATTLATAFLISFYGKPSSVEGAWKYLILNSIGLLLGFFGTLLFLTATSDAGADRLVDWQLLSATTPHLNPLIVKIAFIFVLIGYGTKVGFVPMHTWLPDAYSKAPSPISAVLSGALSNVAILAIVRFKMVADSSIGSEFSGNLMILFGVLSIVVAALLIVLQKNYKRLFAYSSIEHAGIISLGFGFGGIGSFAALLHMLYHALIKTGLFFTAGNILLKFGSTKIAKISGVRSALPVTAVLLILGVLAITGVPPFGTFLTEVYILSAGIKAHVAVVVVVLAMLALVFIGFLRHLIAMVFGDPAEAVKPGESGRFTTIPPVAILIVLIIFSVYLPPPLRSLLESAASFASLIIPMTSDHIIQKYLPANAAAAMHGNVILCPVRPDEIVRLCGALYHEHRLPLKMITAVDERSESGDFRILYLFGLPKEGFFLTPYICVTQDFPALTPTIHEASNYERKLKSFFGLNPVGHPDPRSLILHGNWPDHLFPLRKDFAWDSRPEFARHEFVFRELGGEGIYEIPVGPVHAGIIEPGHFRFSVAGEEILLLEPRLGYSHKGSEKLFETLPLDQKLKLAERISGDSSFSHALAFCLAVERLGSLTSSGEANALRTVFAELERLANHLGDIGAIMADTGYNFGGANCMRLREVVLQLNERLTGSRFLRGVLEFGGVKVNWSDQESADVLGTLERIRPDFEEVIAIAENSSSLLNRLKTTGTLPEQIARDHGVVGVAGRAVGFLADARLDFPYAAYDRISFEIATETSGDVYARYRVRVKEVHSSIEIIRQALNDRPQNGIGATARSPVFPGQSIAIGIVEGWRGDIVYLIATDAAGNISRVDVRDPSFLNWTAVGHACRDNIVPDFPLINKSFNLSYSGNDL